MLIPITHDSKRLWLDFSVAYEKQIYVNSTMDLSRYLIKSIRIDAIYSDEDITPDVTQAARTLIRGSVKREDVIERISSSYGIPIEYTEEMISGAGATRQ
jgi:hypothetical protein